MNEADAIRKVYREHVALGAHDYLARAHAACFYRFRRPEASLAEARQAVDLIVPRDPSKAAAPVFSLPSVRNLAPVRACAAIL